MLSPVQSTPEMKQAVMFTIAAANRPNRQVASSRALECMSVTQAWFTTTLMPTAADTYFTGIKHPAGRPLEEPM